MDKTNRAQSPGKVPVRARDKTHFWNWDNDEESGVRTLCLDGTIADESWWGDEITPRMFKDELFSGSGDIVVWINSPGGDCVAASQIYTMLMDYTGNVTVKIDGLAASAASVIAMAGTEVLMAPTALLMIHNPMSIAIGDTEEMQKAIAMLDEVKESIINAYEIKTGQSRAKISHLMDGETWMNANKAIELGFVDGILEDTKRAHTDDVVFAFSRRAVTNKSMKVRDIDESKGGDTAWQITSGSRSASRARRSSRKHFRTSTRASRCLVRKCSWYQAPLTRTTSPSRPQPPATLSSTRR
ncbi:MAG: Clp protease ClpP [Eubacteriales bacterium]|nr:Clp protease ClpP [Eubacteriales bacterium]MDD4513405.1 Clp protease ClpP [Eubacteriales bacterium]